MTGSVVANRAPAAVGCRVEVRPHGERPECRVEYLTELPGEEPSKRRRFNAYRRPISRTQIQPPWAPFLRIGCPAS